jgi:hypothetical protein
MPAIPLILNKPSTIPSTITTTRVFPFNFEKMDEIVLQEAINVLDSQEFTSERAAVRHFNVKRTTLQERRSGVLPRNKAFQKLQKLSPKEEQYLLA